MKEHVCSFELAKLLADEKLKQESMFYYIRRKCADTYNLVYGIPHFTYKDHQGLIYDSPIWESSGWEIFSAFTASELGLHISRICNEWAQGYEDCYSQWIFSFGNRGAGSMIEGIGMRAYSNQEFEVNARAELMLHILNNEKYPLSKGHETNDI